ncbi:MAG: aminoacyl-tRNA hydrolase [Verrucomicrobia bacterium]|nr:aminoacyl-tRNA hydrolase [Verrucomicrobiota bacterium]
MENQHLIVGLGNPGDQYAHTRHNAGFMVADALAGRWRSKWTLEKKFNARIARGEFGGGRVILCQPQTYMNDSGEAVAAVMNFFKIGAARLMLVVDDADLPLGEIRLRERGGTGGHHGLESVEAHVGSPDYARQRIGIGRRDGAREITGHVLGTFGADEREILGKVLERAADQLESWLTGGTQKAMNQFNGPVAGPAPKE